MLFLSIRVGRDYFALPAAEVVEVLPLVKLKLLPQAPPGVAGLLDWRGTPVPVLDLTLMATGVESRASMATRIALLNYGPDGQDPKKLGLVAEEMTDTFHANENEFVESGVDIPEAAYLGPVLKRGGRIVQRVGIGQLLSPEARAAVFGGVEDRETTHA